MIQSPHSGVGGGYQGYQGYGVQDPGYVTRKELVKSGLLLGRQPYIIAGAVSNDIFNCSGAGILKGALLTTVINNINNNNNGK